MSLTEYDLCKYIWSKSLTLKSQNLNRNFWRVVITIIALLLLWARGEYEEWQSSAAMCQSGVLPDQSDATYGPALAEAGLDANCRSAGSVRGSLSWNLITSSATASIRDATAN